MSQDYDYQFSASKLGLFKEDPQAFYLDHHFGIKKPHSIVAQVTNGLDRNMKALQDQYRGNLPPMLVGQVPGILFPDIEKIKKWRHWKSGLTTTLVIGGKRVKVIGALDDALLTAGALASLDTKTKGGPPKDDGRQWYETQADTYELLFVQNGFPVTGKSYFNYVWPVGCDAEGRVTFANQVYALEASADRVMKLMERAVACLESPRMPNETGKYSEFGQAYRDYCERLDKQPVTV